MKKFPWTIRIKVRKKLPPEVEVSAWTALTHKELVTALQMAIKEIDRMCSGEGEAE